MAHVNYTLFRFPKTNEEANRIDPSDLPIHDWYRFVLSFPPHLVREYMEKFGMNDRSLVLDPFCGTGTTIVECKKNGIPAIGIEALPMPHFASVVKTDWEIDPETLRHHAKQVAERAITNLQKNGIQDEPGVTKSYDHNGLRVLSPESQRLLLKNSISPLPLHKTLVLLDSIRLDRENKFRNHELLALAKALVTTIGNLKFGPEVGLSTIKPDSPVIRPWLANVETIARDLATVSRQINTRSLIYQEDSRNVPLILQSKVVDGVFTSPPYPNEKDYTRTTRLESVLLGLIENLSELRGLKKNLIRSNTRSVYKDDQDDKWILQNIEIQRIAAEIERRRIELGKTSGFERLYHRVTMLYFGGMAQHLASLRSILRPGAFLGYVVGDQASYLRVMIRTGELIAQIADSLGYKVESIDLFRTRLATATGEQLREEVVVLRWPG
ncbi:MAG: DNA methyltransferase [Syntrophaceae bacterium]|nr:DNA methyltransferase [Syntrophaceae bacterium]